jgi:O-methyltransferase
MLVRSLAKRTLNRLRHDPMRYADLTPEQDAVVERVRPYTQTSRERIVTLVDAVQYVIRRGILGDLVECGVWRGGSSMAIAIALLELGASDRRLWLYDTFTKMPPAGPRDRDYAGRSMIGEEPWPSSSVQEVQASIRSTGYPAEHVRYVEGLVEQTIPKNAPDRIALLRLDTDWYSSTRHELEHLYPRLEPGGVLIIDDYGHFAGAREAVDDYFAERPILLARVDYTCRMAVKLP